MTKKELKSFINESMADFMALHGFKYWRLGSSSQSSAWQKNANGVLLRCGYSFLTYNYYKLSNDLAYFLTYIALEELFNPILQKNGLLDKDADPTIRTSCKPHQEQPVNHFDGYVDVYDKSDLPPIIEMYKRSFTEDALPFFEQFSDLNKFYHFIKDETDEEKVWAALCYRPHELKQATLFRLCNDDRWEGILDKFIKEVQIDLENDPSEVNHHKFFNASTELKAVLSITKPLYNV